MSLLERIYSFHSRIQAGRYPNANDLSEEFEISPATAHRDIAYLRDRLLAPLQFDPKKNGYFYTAEGFRLPFEESPRIVLFLGVLSSMAAETGLEGLAEIKQLKKKLTAMVADGKLSIDDKIHCEWIETEPVDGTIFSEVINGLLHDKQLLIQYTKHYSQPGENRFVEPLQLINYQGRWYLLAWCCLRKANRIFHLSRITEVSQTAKEIQHGMPPDDDYLTGVFGIFKGKARFIATIRLTGMAAERVRQQHWHPKQSIKEEEHGILLSLPVADDRELIMKILQFGDEAEVIAPQALREKIKIAINAMAERYA